MGFLKKLRGKNSAETKPEIVPAPPPPRGLAEKVFVREFNELFNEDKYELALDHLIENLDRIRNCKLNRKEKLNHLLFMSRAIQTSGNTKHGWEKLHRKSKQANKVFKLAKVPKDKTFLDLGCGAHDPVALGAYYYLNGFQRSISCDILPVRNKLYAALSMYDVIAHINLYPERFKHNDVDLSDFQRRLDSLNVEVFSKGDFDGALKTLEGRLDYRPDDVLNIDVEDGELGMIVSFAVLEHVDDLDGIMQWVSRKSAPGAVQYHFIDIADHRSYGPDSKYDEWSFLTEEEAPAGMNRLRKSEYLRAIHEAGLEVVSLNETARDVPEATTEALIEPWKSMSDEDIRTVKMTAVIRKPE